MRYRFSCGLVWASLGAMACSSSFRRNRRWWVDQLLELRRRLVELQLVGRLQLVELGEAVRRVVSISLSSSSSSGATTSSTSSSSSSGASTSSSSGGPVRRAFASSSSSSRSSGVSSSSRARAAGAQGSTSGLTPARGGQGREPLAGIWATRSTVTPPRVEAGEIRDDPSDGLQADNPCGGIQYDENPCNLDGPHRRCAPHLHLDPAWIAKGETSGAVEPSTPTCMPSSIFAPRCR